jgi:hypothetical protein
LNAIALIASIAITILGLVLALNIGQLSGNLAIPAIVLFLAFSLLAFLFYWTTRILNFGLELLSDIAEEVHIIRAQTEDKEL